LTPLTFGDIIFSRKEEEEGMKNIKKVGIVVGGGPAPGVNAVISALTITGLKNKVDVFGFLGGYRGVLKNTYCKLTYRDVSEIRDKGGVILRTSRENPLKDAEKLERVKKIFKELNLDAIASIGGDDTLKVANKLLQEGINIVHIPKTIDDDYGSEEMIDVTFGHFSAVEAATRECLNILEDVKSIERWAVVEIMGRKSGAIATRCGIASRASKVIIPEEFEEEEISLERICREIIELIDKKSKVGEEYGMVIVAEGMVEKLPKGDLPKDDHGNIILGKLGLAGLIADGVESHYKERGINRRLISKQVNYEIRATSPIAYDTIYCSMLGYGAMNLILEGKFGYMISLKGGKLISVPFTDLIHPDSGLTKTRDVRLDSDLYQVKKVLEYFE
jgi:6-phosphofructokinase 1